MTSRAPRASRASPTPPPALDPAGILCVDKPAGMTSHDVVDRVRRRFGWKKVGHAGTLDPMATGVLVLLVGKATREQDRFLKDDKTYQGALRLGAATTTHDREGEVTARWEGPLAVERAALEAACARLTGAIEQVPPMVSAVKHKGKPLYKYARKGVEVEREARKVTVHAFEVASFDGEVAAFEVRCSKGTYVRTLAHDVGEALGVHAHLTALRRTRSGPFGEADCISLEDLLASRPEEIVYLLKLPSEVAAAEIAPAPPSPPPSASAAAAAPAPPSAGATPREETRP